MSRQKFWRQIRLPRFAGEANLPDKTYGQELSKCMRKFIDGNSSSLNYLCITLTRWFSVTVIGKQVNQNMNEERPGRNGTKYASLRYIALRAAVALTMAIGWWAPVQAPVQAAVPMHVMSTDAYLSNLQVSALSHGSGQHNCAVLEDGQLLCWGFNLLGQLGNGTLVDQSSPFTVPNVSDATQVWTSYNGTCILRRTSTVQCWGRNRSGSLGTGNLSDSTVPTDVLDSIDGAALTGVTALAVGQENVCVLVTGGYVRCWGGNDAGQLGNATTAPSSVPVTVSNLVSMTELAVGNNNACALAADGTVHCWGKRYSAGIGGSLAAFLSVPVTVVVAVGGAPLTDIVDIRGSEVHTCARTGTGQQYCWGYDHTSYPWSGNGVGTGVGTAFEQLLPVRAQRVEDGVELTNVAQVTVGLYHSCFRMNDGTVRCAGYGSDGQMGDGNDTAEVTRTVVVQIAPSVPMTDVVDITSSGEGNCVIVSHGDVYCWGRNNKGQIGDGSLVTRLRPVEVIRYAGSGNAALLDLKIQPGALGPAFVSTTIDYQASVPNAVSSVAVTPTLSDPAAAYTITSVPGACAPATSPASCDLQAGVNTITVTVTAVNGTMQAYVTVITRLTVPSDASLGGLAITSGTLSPAFVSTTTSYAAEVPYGTASTAVTATVNEVSATVSYSSTAGACTPGAASPSNCAIAASGTTTITVLITSPDRTTSRMYTIAVTVATPGGPTVTATPTPGGLTATPTPTATPGGPTPSPGGPTATPAPLTTIDRVWPGTGLSAGGMPVQIFGSGFVAALTVTVGPYTDGLMIDVLFDPVNDGQIDFVMPAGVAGQRVSVTVATAGEAQTVPDAFTYVEPTVIQFNGLTGGVFTTTDGVVVEIPSQGVDGMFVITMTPLPPEPGVPGNILMYSFRLDALLNWVPLASLTNPVTIKLPVDEGIFALADGERPWLYQWTTDAKPTTDDGRPMSTVVCRPSSVVCRRLRVGFWTLVRGQEYDPGTRLMTVGLKPMGVYALSTAYLRAYWLPLVPVVK